MHCMSLHSVYTMSAMLTLLYIRWILYAYRLHMHDAYNMYNVRTVHTMYTMYTMHTIQTINTMHTIYSSGATPGHLRRLHARMHGRALGVGDVPNVCGSHTAAWHVGDFGSHGPQVTTPPAPGTLGSPAVLPSPPASCIVDSCVNRCVLSCNDVLMGLMMRH